METSGQTLADTLDQAFPGSVSRDISLARISRWRIGGVADVLVRPKDVVELRRLRAFLSKEGIGHLVIGATSNLLFSDAGLRAVLVQIGPHFSHIEINGGELRVGAGVWVLGLARRAMQEGLVGLEHTCGIPGTLGGLICMNGGSQRRGIDETVETVTSVGQDGELLHRKVGDCGFAYRRSVFQCNGEAIVEATLRLAPAEDFWTGRTQIRRKMLAIMGERRRKFPHRTPNCGSVFVSNPAMYAEYGPPGEVIEKLGFKGRRCGGAEVSPWHANFIVNTGGASAADVLALIAEIKAAVHSRTGYNMEVEARYVRSDGAMVAPASADIDDPPRRVSALTGIPMTGGGL